MRAGGKVYTTRTGRESTLCMQGRESTLCVQGGRVHGACRQRVYYACKAAVPQDRGLLGAARPPSPPPLAPPDSTNPYGPVPRAGPP